MSNRALGRYDRISDAVSPGPDLPRSARAMRGKVETALAAVPDPTAIGKEKLQRQRAAVNRLTDPLECERSYGRISEPAYLAGRVCEAIWQRAAIGRGSNAMEPSSGAGDRDAAMVRLVGAVRAAVGLNETLRVACGPYGAKVIIGVLCDGKRFAEMVMVAKWEGKKPKHPETMIAGLFRQGLEDLAEHLDKVGWPR